jgi:hypothetical protein
MIVPTPVTSRRTTRRPRGAFVFAAWLVAAGDLLTWLVVMLSCAVREGRPAYWWGACGHGRIELPLAGVVAALAAVAIWRRGHRPWAFALFTLAVGLGFAPWGWYGDPSGNFGPLLRWR